MLYIVRIDTDTLYYGDDIHIAVSIRDCYEGASLYVKEIDGTETLY